MLFCLQGAGGYAGRLQADNDLHTAIINYGDTTAEDIKNRTGIESTEQAIFMYEFIAESVYREVRLGGAHALAYHTPGALGTTIDFVSKSQIASCYDIET